MLHARYLMLLQGRDIELTMRYNIGGGGITVSPFTCQVKSTFKENRKNHRKNLIIDSRLSFCYHVDFVASKISKTIGLLYKLRSFLPSAALLSLYQCLVLPYFTYGIDSWFATGRSRIQKLEVLQRKCIRAINFLDYNSHTNNFFKMSLQPIIEKN